MSADVEVFLIEMQTVTHVKCNTAQQASKVVTTLNLSHINNYNVIPTLI